ncbi:phenylalanine--tRNA ligase subunit beta [Halomarina oriensis]|uniref:Phenylalanine--tRNA ligase beta subunit n=1 Tax=Halomarina oriensis TaxID=671145 RepID=A0A6B0GMQ5_9EURY|nr:phenylalanine--tRNA ligase subunit beta [Halomarina oriensis]MWG34927.1 phenylalanine--tRNA ligase subunit beta [Halomarina oriensis]
MPVVDVDPDELRQLASTERDDEELKRDLFDLGLEFEGETEDGEFQLEFAPDRLDRLSVEGVARSLRYQDGTDRGVYVPKTNDAEWVIEVDESVPDERPYVTGAIVRGLDMSQTKLDSLIQLQEKLHATMGRQRVKGAIGIHDLTMLKGSAERSSADRSSGQGPRDNAAREGAGKAISYRGITPDADTFVALDSDAELTPGEVLTDHPTGEQYADIVEEYERYPAIYDDIGLFSFPPVINGRRTEVDDESRDLFIELTGTDQWTIDKMCTILCYALDARGGRVEEVRVEYPEGHPSEQRDLLRPDLDVDEKTVTHARVEQLLGVELDESDVVDYLERAGLDAEPLERDGEPAYRVGIPPYRVDVLNPVDVVDDVGRAHGFNELSPRYPDVSTVGGRHETARLESAARDALVGSGFEDMLDFHMTSERDCFDRMGLDIPDELAPDAPLGQRPPVTIAEPYSEDYTVVRTWALPSLLTVLENNTHRAYPQNLAEIGLAAHVDEREETKAAERRTVAAVLARTDAGYEDAKARLQALAGAFGKALETPATTHPSFIEGRTAAVELDGERVGVVGEVHPRVLVEHDLELPVAAFEFDLSALE